MPSSTLPSALEPTMDRKEAIQWARNTLSLFPQAAGAAPTEEFVAALISLICQFPRNVVEIVLHPTKGVPVDLKYKFLPSLAEFKFELDRQVGEIAQRAKEAKRLQEQLLDREQFNQHIRPHTKSLYEGPIEDIRPGDRISWKRSKEYDEFMSKKHSMKKVKRWERDETWIDSGARPFAAKFAAQPITIEKPQQDPDKNPFDE
jgi:hypothetical protein